MFRESVARDKRLMQSRAFGELWDHRIWAIWRNLGYNMTADATGLSVEEIRFIVSRRDRRKLAGTPQ